MIMNPLKGDNTLYRGWIGRYMEFVKEYEVIKKGEHQEFCYVKDWAKARKICKKNFLKYYNRFKQFPQP